LLLYQICKISGIDYGWFLRPFFCTHDVLKPVFYNTQRKSSEAFSIILTVISLHPLIPSLVERNGNLAIAFNPAYIVFVCIGFCTDDKFVSMKHTIQEKFCRPIVPITEEYDLFIAQNIFTILKMLKKHWYFRGITWPDKGIKNHMIQDVYQYRATRLRFFDLFRIRYVLVKVSSILFNHFRCRRQVHLRTVAGKDQIFIQGIIIMIAIELLCKPSYNNRESGRVCLVQCLKHSLF